jgi:hypothetical protein
MPGAAACRDENDWAKKPRSLTIKRANDFLIIIIGTEAQDGFTIKTSTGNPHPCKWQQCPSDLQSLSLSKGSLESQGIVELIKAVGKSGERLDLSLSLRLNRWPIRQIRTRYVPRQVYRRQLYILKSSLGPMRSAEVAREGDQMNNY